MPEPVLTEVNPDVDLHSALGTGLCGTLTTYSTLGYETLRLAQDRAHFDALANITASIIGFAPATSASPPPKPSPAQHDPVSDEPQQLSVARGAVRRRLAIPQPYRP